VSVFGIRVVLQFFVFGAPAFAQEAEGFEDALADAVEAGFVTIEQAEGARLIGKGAESDREAGLAVEGLEVLPDSLLLSRSRSPASRLRTRARRQRAATNSSTRSASSGVCGATSRRQDSRSIWN
jgi:hypothetical protein